MTHRIRMMIAVVMLLALLSPFATMPHAAAQSALDGSACWQPGQLTIAGAQMSWPVPPATIIDLTQSYQAVLQTTAGTIQIALDAANAPIATNNFICLALAGYYTGTDFHRIFANTLIQGGDPTATGSGNPGYTISSDPTMGNYPVGSVSMANTGPDRNGSQFFIAATDLTGLIPNQYPVFGQVTAGMEIVTTISNGPVTTGTSGEQSKPLDPAILLTVTVTASGSPEAPAGPVIALPTATATSGDMRSRRPGNMPTEGNQTGNPDAAGCAGLDDYTNAFDDTYIDVATQYPDALAFLMSLQNGDGSQNMFEQMNAAQASAMSSFYYGLADAAAQIAPPSFAVEWHAVQIEIFRALGDFTGKIASQGITLAAMQASPILNELIERSDTATANATAVCAEFLTWIDNDSAK